MKGSKALDERVLFERLSNAVMEGDAEASVKATKEILEAGIDPITVIESCLSPAIKLVGEKFAACEYFLTNLMLSAEAMKASSELLSSEIAGRGGGKPESGAIVVIGTVAGDIHDIGKNIISVLLSMGGFEVYDLGREVPSMTFVETAERLGAKVIALSSLMTTTVPSQREVIEFLKGMKLRGKYLVIIGGGSTTQAWANEIGADGWAETAVQGVALTKRLVREKFGIA